MGLLRRLLSFYLPIAPQRLVYMLQLVEYDWRKFLAWYIRLPDLRRVMHRGKLVYTKKAQVLLLIAYGVYVIGGLTAVTLATINPWYLALLLFVPDIIAGSLVLVVLLGSIALKIRRRGILGHAQQKLAASESVKIAVLGSYGKTTMKELLLAVLGEAKRTKATPGNMNVPISHARWIMNKLDGSEEVVILEYGEGEPGDIAAFAELSSPDYAVLTGIAPNHLDKYPDYQALKADLAVISKYVPADHLFVNQQAARELALDEAVTYDDRVVDGWDISQVSVGYEGTHFVIAKQGQKLELHSPLLGRHQVGPLAAVAALALRLGLMPERVVAGVASMEIFPHRMQPRQLHGAWIVDDTYNGNLEGIRAGLALLKDLPAKRKIYVTPGLVDQGIESQRVHREIGELIAAANPNKVVLMQNSATADIQAGLSAANYNGELQIETDPLGFYTNLEHHVAAGDLYMLQNDWPDQYS